MLQVMGSLLYYHNIIKLKRVWIQFVWNVREMYCTLIPYTLLSHGNTYRIYLLNDRVVILQRPSIPSIILLFFFFFKVSNSFLPVVSHFFSSSSFASVFHLLLLLLFPPFLTVP